MAEFSRIDETKVAQGYDKWSEVYDHDKNPLSELDRLELRRCAGNVQGLKVLELGCGTGKHTEWLLQGEAKVSALDFSDGMLEKAKQRLPAAQDLTFKKHTLSQSLPFANDAFDCVVSGLVLEHLNDLNLFFSEIRRVLKPGGKGYISAMHPAMWLIGKQAKFTDPATGEKSEPGSINYKIGDFVMAVLNSGLQLTAIKELSPDKCLAREFPRAEKYINYPMLLILEIQAHKERS